MRNTRTLHWPHLLAPSEEKVVVPFLWIGTAFIVATTLAIYAYAAVSGM